MANLWLGTSSWQFPAWRGVFYPPELKQAAHLNYYGCQFNSVEVNTSFYGLPEPHTLLKWVDAVPEDFAFVLKFPRQISHELRLLASERESLAFLDVLRALGEYAGPGFLQLPPNFTREGEGRVLARYLEWLSNEREESLVAVEVRAHDLATEPFGSYLASLGMSPVLVDRAGWPDLFDEWHDAIQKSNFAMIRWIGDDRNGPKGDREISAPQDAKLKLWARRIVQLLSEGVDVYGFMHNPYEGHSPESVRRLLTELQLLDITIEWPPEDGAVESGCGSFDAERKAEGRVGSAEGGTAPDDSQLSLF
jgi:uncharacterized protein YecE (DUF72 family)